MPIPDIKQHGEEGEKNRASVRETRWSKKLISGHIHEKQYARFRYPWQPYAMNWVWKTHGNTTDTLFMFDSGSDRVRVKETVWHCVCVCTRGRETEVVNRHPGNLPKTCLSHGGFAKWRSNLPWALGEAGKRTCCDFQRKQSPLNTEITEMQQQAWELLGLNNKCWIYAFPKRQSNLMLV